MRSFLCMFNTDRGQFNDVYQVDEHGTIVGESIRDLFGMDCFEVENHFEALGEKVLVLYEQFS